ncbi:MAG TPA: Hsp20/alpha crystallin family protein [Acidobacteriota bacterium]
MNLLRWEPFAPLKEMEKFFDEFSFMPVLPKAKIGWDLAVDLYEDKDNLIAEMNLPGINPEKIEITFQNGGLKIAAAREEIKETKEKQFYSKEIRRGSFERFVQLPCEVKKEKTEAQFKNGVLKITIPKKETLKEHVKVHVQ